jgi:hypothetical protein
MRLPPDLSPGTWFEVKGRGDLTPGYTVGPYAVEHPSGGWTQGGSATVLGVRTSAASTDYGFEVRSPEGQVTAVACTARRASTGAAIAPGFSVSSTLQDNVRCTVGAAELVLERASVSSVRGQLRAGARTLSVEPVEGLEGSTFPAIGGLRLAEGDHTLAALETMGAGRLLVAPGAAPGDADLAVAALGAVLAWPADSGE